MNPIFYFDISAVIMLIAMLAFALSRKMTKGTTYKICLIFLAETLLVASCSLLTAIASNYPQNFSVPFRYVTHTLYLVLRNAHSPLFVVYLISLFDVWHRVRRLGNWLFCSIPYAVIVFLFILNPFNHKMFYIDANLKYVRGPCFFALYIVSVFYFILSMHYVARYQKCLSRAHLFGICSIYPLSVVSVVIQLFIPNLLVEMYALSLAIYFIFNTVQRPEDNLEVQTNTFNSQAYGRNLLRSFENNKIFDLIIVDITNFSSLTTMLGFDKARKMLYQVAQLITKIVSLETKFAKIYYLDNGRFRIEIDSIYIEDINGLAREINEEFLNPIYFQGMELNLMMRVCMVKCPEDIDQFDVLNAFDNKISEMASYTGKILTVQELKNGNQLLLGNQLDSIIEYAIAAHKFEVYYQPIFSVKSGKFESAEALLRLKDDTYGFISPAQFIPAAEKSGAIHQIGDFVLKEVIEFLASDEFKASGLKYIEVNLSVSQCMDIGLAQKILDLLNEYGVSRKSINLEITETAASYSQNTFIDNLQRLDAEGISFSLDDYGTGYSNIERVCSLPLKIVKLDKTFADLIFNKKMSAILSSTVQMLKDLEMEVVIEGVETAEMLQTFTDLKCDFIQGYYFSKPIPKQEFLAFLEERRAV